MIRNKIFLMTTTLCFVTPCVTAVAAPSENYRSSTKKHSVGQVHSQNGKAVPAKSASSRVVPARHKDTGPMMAGEAETINVTTGTHSTNRKARQSTSPVTVVSAATLARSGQMNLADALTRTYASINVVAMGADSAALTSSIQMRGLGPNEVLVLVDGKRRHNTANIVADSGP